VGNNCGNNYGSDYGNKVLMPNGGRELSLTGIS